MKRVFAIIGIFLLFTTFFIFFPMAYFAVIDNMSITNKNTISFPQQEDIPTEYKSAAVYHTYQKNNPILLILVDDEIEKNRQIMIIQEQLNLLRDANLISEQIHAQVMEKIQPENVWIHSATTALSENVSVLTIEFYYSYQNSAYDSFCKMTVDLSQNRALTFSFSFSGLKTDTLPDFIFDLQTDYRNWLGFIDIKDWFIISEADNSLFMHSPSLKLSSEISIVSNHTLLMSLYAYNDL